MNALVKKEIRLLWPSFLLGLALAFSVWLIPPKSVTGIREGLVALPFLCCPVVLVMMMLDSFGHELSAGTFSLLLAQPVPRLRIWRIKTLLLGVAGLLIWLVWCVCYFLHNPDHLKPVELLQMFAGFALYVLVGYSGGLWTVLLFRQVAAAFWFTVLIPAILVVILGNLLEGCSNHVQFSVPAGVFTLYGIAGFLLARWLFLRAQDVAWTGGVISFSRWHSFESGIPSGVSLRRRRPIAALLKKEFQLHSISLFCAGALLVLHVGVFCLRIFYANYHKNSLAADVSYFFWALWPVIPLVIGCTAVAEERKLGVAEAQFCQPVSRRAQFAIKFIPALIFGTLLGGVMSILLEAVAAHFGVPNEYFWSENLAGNGFGIPGIVCFEISIVALAAGLAWAGFFASTLARNFLQALGIAIVTVLGCVLFTIFLARVIEQQMTFFGITPWHSILPLLIAIPTIPAALLWLAWLNFSHFREGWRLWRRNILGLAGAVVFIIVSSTVIYNRVWEVFEPMEPSTARRNLHYRLRQNCKVDYDSLLVRLPDGRVWFDSWDSGFYGQFNWWNQLRWCLAPPLPKSAGPQQFIAGSNWVAATAMREDWWYGSNHIVGYLDTVGIKNDGTLWISAESKPETWGGTNMVRFGNETNWQQVAGHSNVFCL